MHVLSARENGLLLSVLFKGGDSTFKDYADQFRKNFRSADTFRILCAAYLLLEDANLLLLPQRLVTWYLLWALYTSKGLQDNPFLTFLVEGYCNPGPRVTCHERCLLTLLVQTLTLDQVSDLSPQQFTSTCSPKLLEQGPPAEVVKATLLARCRANTQIGGRPQPHQSSVVPAPGQGPVPGPSRMPLPGESSGSSLSALHTQQQALLPGPPPASSEPSLDAPLMCPQPPIINVTLEELKWLHPHRHQPLIWDSCLGQDGHKADEVRALVNKAIQGPLLPVQVNQVLREFDRDPTLVHHLGLTPEKLPDLVENAPMIAYEFLSRMMKSRGVLVYLQVLAEMGLSLHSMEVVNKLTTHVDLPVEFIQVYIIRCMNSCEAIQDKYMQSRLVRLVCVFMKSLFRTKAIYLQGLLHEVQAFCINFSRVKEAAALFRLLKQLESGNPSLDIPSGVGGLDEGSRGNGDGG